MATWTGKSRGNVLGYKIVVSALRIFGLPAAYALVRFISYYFYLFAGEPKRQLLHFYTAHLNIPLAKAKKLCRTNFNLMGQNLLDRIALTIGKGNKISYSQTGENHLINWAKEGKGGFLVSAHVGNWAVAGNLLKAQNVKMNVLMLENEKENLKAFLDSQKGAPQFNIIGISEDGSHLISIYKALKKGEFIAINADRFLPGMRTIELDFLSKKAHFPEGVFKLIEKLNSKYSFVFAAKEEKYRYHFSATLPKLPQNNASEIAQNFADALATEVKNHPEQWFNYYPFFANPNE